MMEKKFSPMSFKFTAANAGVSTVRRFEGLQDVGTGSPDGQIETVNTNNLTTSITDCSFWDGRYALTEIDFETKSGKKLKINDAMVSISSSKKIIRTPLVGLDGTIKEHVNSDDYDITISIGVVALDENGRITDAYPTEGIETIKEFLDEKKEIGVASEFFKIFDIDQIVIERFSLKQETHSNRQTIEVKAWSDKDYVMTPEY